MLRVVKKVEALLSMNKDDLVDMTKDDYDKDDYDDDDDDDDDDEDDGYGMRLWWFII